ncbi:MAG: peptidase T [Akkermansia sp.]
MKVHERFLKYVQIHTTSDPNSSSCPSAEREFDLAKILVKELLDMGISDARVDEHCYVYASLPATPGYEKAPAIGLIAHMDTAPDAKGENVKAILHENYQGGDVILPATGDIMSVEKFPFLREMKGETLITTDGTTLLGADDKAGIAEIMTAIETIISEEIAHGRICIAFTPDEEIGAGTDAFDIKGFGADFAYTVDGGNAGEIEYDNFNAAEATVSITGFGVHPGSAKNIMLNANNLALEFHHSLPALDRPEHTQNREGFYHLHHIQGDGSKAELNYLIRDHDFMSFNHRKQSLRKIAEVFNEKYGQATVELTIKDSYLNMLEKIKEHFHLVETAREAIKQAGLVVQEPPVRGGTDGAHLSWEGLPCPNLGTGGFNFHGTFECTTIQRMEKATQVIINIVKLYRDKSFAIEMRDCL